MLKMKASWMKWCSGAVVAALYRRLRSQKLRTVLAREMISASFDLANAAGIRRFKRLHRVRQIDDLKWRIGELYYLYYPVVNDQILFRWLDYQRKNRDYFLIVPPDYDCLFRDALRAILDKQTPSVFSLDGFISWRTTFASIDLSLRHDGTTLWLLRRFNRRVRKLPSGKFVAIDLTEVETLIPVAARSRAVR